MSAWPQQGQRVIAVVGKHEIEGVYVGSQWLGRPLHLVDLGDDQRLYVVTIRPLGGVATLTDFLLARVAEDEAQVEYATDPGGWTLSGDERGYPVISRSRVLAECEAKRRIVGLHRRVDLFHGPDDRTFGCDICGDRLGDTFSWDCLEPGESLWPCLTIGLLALPYADHPDYRQEWRL